MAVLLKQRDKECYVKSVSWVDGKVEFTDSTRDAKRYSNDWFANAEKSQLTHYANLTYEEGGLNGDYKDTIKELEVHYT